MDAYDLLICKHPCANKWETSHLWHMRLARFHGQGGGGVSTPWFEHRLHVGERRLRIRGIQRDRLAIRTLPRRNFPPCSGSRHWRNTPMTVNTPLYIYICIFYLFFRLTVLPVVPLFSLTVQLLDPFPRCVECIEDIPQINAYGQRLY